MANRNRFLIAVLGVLSLGALCGLCLGTSSAGLVFRWFTRPTAVVLRSPAAIATSSATGVSPSSPTAGQATAPATATQPATITLTATLPTSPTQALIQAAATQAFPAATEVFPLLSTESGESGLLETTPTSGSLARDAWCVPWNAPSTWASVRRVLDGVTIEVQVGRDLLTVRYLGVDLLDYTDDFTVWSRALEANRLLVEGKTVLLVQDRSDKDPDGRLLRYVIADGIFVNDALVRRGYAAAVSMPPDTRCDLYLNEAQAMAEYAEAGLWAPLPTPTRTFPPPTATFARSGDVQITYIRPKGVKWQEPNEFVEIYNNSTEPVQLQGWTLRDQHNHVFTFPSYAMVSGQYCRIYTNEYHSATCGFSYSHPAPIWDDEVECAYLKDADGNLVSTLCYE